MRLKVFFGNASRSWSRSVFVFSLSVFLHSFTQWKREGVDRFCWSLLARPVFSPHDKTVKYYLVLTVQLHFQKLMVFQPRWPHLQATILPLQMNSNPRWKSGNLNSGARSHLGPLIISYVHIPAGMRACTGAHKHSPGCHRHLAWIFECQSCSIGGGSSRDSVSIWGGRRGENEFVPLWRDWHILLFLFHTRRAYIVCMNRRRQL